jgi:hypothetical protein
MEKLNPLERSSMPTINFYRQGRQDGGLRTGIEINRNPLFGRFEEGQEDYDPALSWFIDLEIQGDSIPDRPEEGRRWLVEHAKEIREALISLADEMRAGVDVDVWPLRKAVISESRGKDYRAQITCSAVRRFEGQHLAEQLRDIANRWEGPTRDLPAVEEVCV